MAQEKKGMKGYYGITFLIGIGFFTMGLMDPLYDTYVPVFLNNFLKSDMWSGLIMGLDNLFALILIPVVSVLSDKARTPIGRRMPFILVTLPLTAFFFGWLPFSALMSLAALIIVIFFLNLFKQSARGPVVALMPDIIPGEYRSEANGVINTMGGIAAIVGTVALAPLYDLSTRIPILGDTRRSLGDSASGAYVGTLPFILSGILVVVAVILLFIFVRERKGSEVEKTEEKVPIVKSLKLILGSADKRALYILLSLLLWFIGYQGILPWIGRYSIEYLGLKPGLAGFSAGMVGIAYALFAIPSGVIAHRIGRRKMIRLSLVCVTVIVLVIFFHYPVTRAFGLSHSATYMSFWALLFLFGAFWVSIITNSFPMLWQMASYSNMGIYTGLYYFFSQLAGILAPGITGFLRDTFGDRSIFISGAVCLFAAFLMMGLVRKGEPGEK